MVDGQAIISDPNTRFWPAARQFDLEIRRAGGKTVLYQTWAGPGKPENSDALAHAYFTIGKELEAIVIPAGVAWQRALKERPDLPLFMSDQSHPAPAGTYLTAMVTLATLFGGVTDPPLMVRGHQTGFDNKPADSVGTLASIDSETRALFGRIVTSVHREVEQAGGYLSIARPAMPALAPMPAGRPIRAQALDGSWKGTLTLFNTGSPAQLSLELRPGTGGEYIGSSTMQLDKPMRDDSIRLTIVGQEVRFSLQSPVDQLPIQFRGVLTADDRLEGRAVIESDERGWSFSGSWILTRAESH
jgi:hypothetical protein